MKMACCTRKCRGIFLSVYGLVGVCVGILVAIVFLALPEVHNVHAGVWGFVSFLFALSDSLYGCLLWMSWKVLRRITMVFFLLGCFGLSIGTTSFIAYLAYGVVYTEEGDSLVGTYYLACVWCFMVFKWSMLLMVNSVQDDRMAALEKKKEKDNTDNLRSVTEGKHGKDEDAEPFLP
jgi:hypothetical protein